MASLPTEARDIVPDQVAALDDALKVGRQAIQTADYESASISLTGIPDQVRLLADSLPGRRAALRAEMDTLEIVVPKNLEAIQAELDHLARSGRTPPGLTRDQLAEVRQIQDSAALLWAEVKSRFEAGKLAESMATAQNLKARVSRALLALGLVADERAWSNVTLPPGSNR